MLYKIKVSIECDLGEIIERQHQFVSFDEMRELDINSIIDDGEKYAKEAGYDKTFESEEAAEMSKEDFTGVSNEDR